MYIGQSKNLKRRFGEHSSDLKHKSSHNLRLQHDYDLYGDNHFSFSVLYEGTDCLDEKEKQYIAEYRKLGCCYNVFSGGLSGFSGDDEFIAKSYEIHKGYKASEEAKAKMSEQTKKQWENPQYRNLMIESAKSQWKNPEYREIMKNCHSGKIIPNVSKLTPEIVVKCRKRYNNGESISVLAKENGVKYAAMYQAVHYITWKTIE